jgi:hypothetical protein
MKPKNKVKNKNNTGVNVRFSKSGHEALKTFTKKRGLHLGMFCEMAALEKKEHIEKTETVKRPPMGRLVDGTLTLI